ncbi:MAG: N-acetyl-gamma-glutamyl-phosphate reductase [Myxococcota bacterium]
MIRVGIAGVTAYTGQQAARLVAGHPGLRVATASSDAIAGNRLRTLDRDLGPDGEAVVVGHGDTVSAARDVGVDVMFLATPPEQCGRLVPDLRDAGIRVVDLSGAHRIEEPRAHLSAYGFERARPDVVGQAVYGLTEWADRAALARTGLVANPGGFPTAILLALLPLLRADLVDLESLVVDGKCGTSAAGRSARVSLLFSELYGNFYADLVGPNRHTPEITQELTRRGAERMGMTFVAHLLPVARGIFTTCYVRPSRMDDVTQAAELARAAMEASYAESPFVRVLERPEDVHLDHVAGTNRCQIAVTGDPHGGRLIVVSALDNLLKGGAGQAIQNANLMFGLAEDAGLAHRFAPGL